MYVEATYGQIGDVTSLRTPPLMTSEVACLTFYRHIYGRHVGVLVVVISDGKRRRPVFSISGQQKDLWAKTQLLLSHNLWVQENIEKYIIFKVFRGDGFAGDIAIDDVTLETGHCDSLPGESCSFNYYSTIISQTLLEFVGILLNEK